MASRAGAALLASLLAVGAALLLWTGRAHVPDPIRMGVPAPDFELERLDGRGRLSLEALRGRVVLLNFWATWCKPCEEEMPAMQRLYEALAPQGFELVAVSVDDEAEPVRRFRDRLGLSFPILLDPGSAVARRYQSLRYPESYLIDAEGGLVARFIGPREWDAPLYVERLRRLLAGEG